MAWAPVCGTGLDANDAKVGTSLPGPIGASTASSALLLRSMLCGARSQAAVCPPAPQVACRQLGLGGTATPVPGSKYGAGTGSIWLESVACAGTEATLEACPTPKWGRTKCPGHKNDAGLTCTATAGDLAHEQCALMSRCCSSLHAPRPALERPPAAPRPAATVRLVSGGVVSNPLALQGRLEVNTGGSAWATVCDDW